MTDTIMHRCSICGKEVVEEDLEADIVDIQRTRCQECRERFAEKREQEIEEGAKTGGEIFLLVVGIIWLIGAIIIVNIGLGYLFLDDGSWSDTLHTQRGIGFIGYGIFSAIIGSLFVIIGLLFPTLRRLRHAITKISTGITTEKADKKATNTTTKTVVEPTTIPTVPSVNGLF
jgi:hypothetical protein